MPVWGLISAPELSSRGCTVSAAVPFKAQTASADLATVLDNLCVAAGVVPTTIGVICPRVACPPLLPLNLL